MQADGEWIVKKSSTALDSTSWSSSPSSSRSLTVPEQETTSSPNNGRMSRRITIGAMKKPKSPRSKKKDKQAAIDLAEQPHLSSSEFGAYVIVSYNKQR